MKKARQPEGYCQAPLLPHASSLAAAALLGKQAASGGTLLQWPTFIAGQAQLKSTLPPYIW